MKAMLLQHACRSCLLLSLKWAIPSLQGMPGAPAGPAGSTDEQQHEQRITGGSHHAVLGATVVGGNAGHPSRGQAVLGWCRFEE